jgi:hypothetical protein
LLRQGDKVVIYDDRECALLDLGVAPDAAVEGPGGSSAEFDRAPDRR